MTFLQLLQQLLATGRVERTKANVALIKDQIRRLELGELARTPNKVKQHRVRAALNDPAHAGWSDGAIGDLCGVSKTMVRSMRTRPEPEPIDWIHDLLTDSRIL